MLHYFNPGHETAVLNQSPYYTPASNLLRMQWDLAYLPAWYANPDDYVLIEEKLPEDFSFSLKPLYPIASGITKEEICFTKNYLINEEIVLWGISPQAIHYWEQIKQTSELNLHIPAWKAEYQHLCSRFAANECLKYLQENIPEIQPDIIPQFYHQLEDIENLVKKQPFPLLAKSPYSSSGRGLLWLPKGELTRTERQILHGMLKKQSAISVEKVLNKKLDFAMEFFSDGNGLVCFKGYSLFQTTNKGAYSGNWIASQKRITEKIKSWTDENLLNSVRNKLINFLQKYASIYKGCIGIDMMAYDDNSRSYLHPCVEINMRYNMGWLSIHLHEKVLHENTTGFFHIDFNDHEKEIYLQHQHMQQSYPAVFTNKKLTSGYFSLCPVTEKTKYRAYLIIP